MFYSTISNYFSFDARFFKSFFPLLFKPGYLLTKFIEGKRLLYLHPAQTYLFVAVVSFFLFSFVQSSQIQRLDKQLAKTLKKESVSKGIKEIELADSLNFIKNLNQKKVDSIAKEKSRSVLNENKIVTSFSTKELDSLVSNKNFSEK